MNLLMIILLSGLAMKAILSLMGWLWNVANSENGWTNTSKRVAELGKLDPVQYLRIRSGVSRKVKYLAPTLPRLTPALSGLAHLPMASPPSENKKSA